jgi:CHASE3 domain sensor protein
MGIAASAALRVTEMLGFGDMRDLSPTTIRVAVWELFGVAACMIVLFLGLIAWNLRRVDDEWASDAQAAAMARNLEGLGEEVLEAETSERGYLLTHNVEYLAGYEAGARMARSRIAELRRGAGDSLAYPTLDQLGLLASSRLDELSMTLSLARSGQESAALQAVRDGPGWTLMEAFRSLRTEALGTQRQILDERRARRGHDTIVAWLVLITAAAAAVLVLYLCTWRTAEQLEIQAQALL